jgi:hypothetical protein
MNYHHIFLLLLVVLSTYFESPQDAKPPDPSVSTMVTVCLNSSFVSLGILAPVLPQNEVYQIILPQNEVYKSVHSWNEMFKIKIINYQFNKVKITIGSLLNAEDKSLNFLTLTLIHGEEKTAWMV